MDVWSARHGSNAWSQWSDTIAAWRSGDQLGVTPKTLEFSPALTCNLACATCPYGPDRKQLTTAVVGADESAREDDAHAATIATTRRVLEVSRDAGVRGVLWTGGGEPTIYAPLGTMLSYASSLGLANALYTNGTRLGTDQSLAPRLMRPASGLAFVRVSINAVTPAIVEQHWGAPYETVAPQMAGLVALLAARNLAFRGGGTPPSVQISTIVDQHNVADLERICAAVADIFARHRQVVGPEDVQVVRPVTYHNRAGGYRVDDHHEPVIAKIVDVCRDGGAGERHLARARLKLALGFGLGEIAAARARSYAELLTREYERRSKSLATGLFLHVGPDGSVFPSTETMCHRGFEIGNLRHESVSDIWRGAKRREMLDRFNAQRWGAHVAQATARTARLDRIAEAIRDGAVTDAQIEAVRQRSLCQHSLLLD